MKHFIFFFLLLTGSLLHAQKNQIHLNQYGQMIGKDGKEEISQILPNQKILIDGVLKESLRNPDEISMTVYSSSQVASTPISVIKTANGYRALIGPFLPKESVGLEIYANKKIDNLQKKKILKVIAGGFNNALEALKITFKSTPGITPQAFEDIALKAIQDKMADTMNIYTLKGKKLKDDFPDFVPVSVTSTDFQELMGYVDDFQKAQNDTDSTTAQTSIDTKRDNIFDEIISKIVNSDLIGVELLDVSVIVSEIMFHASFDITPALTTLGNSRSDSVRRNFGMFFTFSPYFFARIPPDASMIEYATGAKNKVGSFFRAIAYMFQPTVGIGIVGNKDVKLTPLVFTGGTFRFNQLFKLTYGLAFNSKEKFNTVGLSININYFGDILKAFQTAQANSNF